MKVRIITESNKYLLDYYENHDEGSRLLARRDNVEFVTTMRYIEKHLHPGMRVPEIGASTAA